MNQDSVQLKLGLVNGFSDFIIIFIGRGVALMGSSKKYSSFQGLSVKRIKQKIHYEKVQ
jgi:hypothetical protein